MKDELKYKVSDKVKVFIYEGGLVYEYQTEILFLDKRDGQAWVPFFKGDLVTPDVCAYYGFPTSMEGIHVYKVSINPNFYRSFSGWGKILSKVTEKPELKQKHSHEPGGMFCLACKSFVQYASVNMSNGSFVCRHCRKYKSWLIPEDAHFIGFEGERE